MPLVLDGKQVRDAIFASLRPRVERLTAAGRPPGLAVVLVGADPASATYVGSKIQACESLGIFSEKHRPTDMVETDELLFLIRSLNQRPDIDGILVQLPLPPQVDTQAVLMAVDPDKDVDGFHPVNVGHLVAGRPGLRACTPSGIMEMLAHYRIPIAGKHAVVIGRSDIVGKPMALMLLHANATVTVCHSKTADLAAECRRADILVSAIGRAGLVTPEHVSPDAVVVDVGTNWVSDAAQAEALLADSPARHASFREKGRVLVGDVHPAVYSRCAAYTPVPGGVGPLTIAMLMSNTVFSAERRLGLV
jgi:methylenetetrahydrofolate dehydrogenase (NADP+)/methenyltetrahydrofolate cyclohydrolase